MIIPSLLDRYVPNPLVQQMIHDLSLYLVLANIVRMSVLTGSTLTVTFISIVLTIVFVLTTHSAQWSMIKTLKYGNYCYIVYTFSSDKHVVANYRDS